MKIKPIIYFLLLFFHSTNLYANERVLFEIDNEIFTTIDLKNRANYLDAINVNKNQKEIYDDFKSVIFFDIYSKNNNINIPAEKINEYIDIIHERMFEIKNIELIKFMMNTSYFNPNFVCSDENDAFYKMVDIKNEEFEVSLKDEIDLSPSHPLQTLT